MLYITEFYFICLLCSTYANPTWTPLEEKLSVLLEIWRSGTNEVLPPLDPIYIAAVEGSYEIPPIRLNYKIGDMVLTELGGFSLKELNASEENLSVFVRIHIPVVTLTAKKYTLKGYTFIFFPIQCSGAMEIQIRDSILAGSIRLHYNGSSTSVENAVFKINVGSVKTHFDDCTLLNPVMNGEVKRLLDGNQEVSHILEGMFIQSVNKLLIRLSPQQLMEAIDDIVYEA